jgi:hypothetical protein
MACSICLRTFTTAADVVVITPTESAAAAGALLAPSRAALPSPSSRPPPPLEPFELRSCGHAECCRECLATHVETCILSGKLDGGIIVPCPSAGCTDPISEADVLLLLKPGPRPRRRRGPVAPPDDPDADIVAPTASSPAAAAWKAGAHHSVVAATRAHGGPSPSPSPSPSAALAASLKRRRHLRGVYPSLLRQAVDGNERCCSRCGLWQRGHPSAPLITCTFCSHRYCYFHGDEHTSALPCAALPALLRPLRAHLAAAAAAVSGGSGADASPSHSPTPTPLPHLVPPSLHLRAHEATQDALASLGAVSCANPNCGAVLASADDPEVASGASQHVTCPRCAWQTCVCCGQTRVRPGPCTLPGSGRAGAARLAPPSLRPSATRLQLPPLARPPPNPLAPEQASSSSPSSPSSSSLPEPRCWCADCVADLEWEDQHRRLSVDPRAQAATTVVGPPRVGLRARVALLLQNGAGGGGGAQPPADGAHRAPGAAAGVRAIEQLRRGVFLAELAQNMFNRRSNVWGATDLPPADVWAALGPEPAATSSDGGSRGAGGGKGRPTWLRSVLAGRGGTVGGRRPCVVCDGPRTSLSERLVDGASSTYAEATVLVSRVLAAALTLPLVVPVVLLLAFEHFVRPAAANARLPRAALAPPAPQPPPPPPRGLAAFGSRSRLTSDEAIALESGSPIAAATPADAVRHRLLTHPDHAPLRALLGSARPDGDGSGGGGGGILVRPGSAGAADTVHVRIPVPVSLRVTSALRHAASGSFTTLVFLLCFGLGLGLTIWSAASTEEEYLIAHAGEVVGPSGSRRRRGGPPPGYHFPDTAPDGHIVSSFEREWVTIVPTVRSTWVPVLFMILLGVLAPQLVHYSLSFFHLAPGFSSLHGPVGAEANGAAAVGKFGIKPRAWSNLVLADAVEASAEVGGGGPRRQPAVRREQGAHDDEEGDGEAEGGVDGDDEDDEEDAGGGDGSDAAAGVASPHAREMSLELAAQERPGIVWNSAGPLTAGRARHGGPASASDPAPPPTVDCQMCLETRPSSECIRIRPCRHWFCRECVVGWLSAEVDARRSAPRCPFSITLSSSEIADATRRMQEERQAAALGPGAAAAAAGAVAAPPPGGPPAPLHSLLPASLRPLLATILPGTARGPPAGHAPPFPAAAAAAVAADAPPGPVAAQLPVVVETTRTCGVTVHPTTIAAALSAHPRTFARYRRLRILLHDPSARECPTCGNLQRGRRVEEAIAAAAAASAAAVAASRAAVASAAGTAGRGHGATAPARPPASDAAAASAAASAASTERDTSALLRSSAAASAASPAEAPSPASDPLIACGGCGTTFCALHSNAHAGRSCAEYAASIAGAEAATTALLAGEGGRVCANTSCGAFIFKHAGCDTVTCARCAGVMCYRCGRGMGPSPLGNAMGLGNGFNMQAAATSAIGGGGGGGGVGGGPLALGPAGAAAAAGAATLVQANALLIELARVSHEAGMIGTDPLVAGLALLPVSASVAYVASGAAPHMGGGVGALRPVELTNFLVTGSPSPPPFRAALNAGTGSLSFALFGAPRRLRGSRGWEGRFASVGRGEGLGGWAQQLVVFAPFLIIEALLFTVPSLGAAFLVFTTFPLVYVAAPIYNAPIYIAWLAGWARGRLWPAPQGPPAAAPPAEGGETVGQATPAAPVAAPTAAPAAPAAPDVPCTYCGGSDQGGATPLMRLAEGLRTYEEGRRAAQGGRGARGSGRVPIPALVRLHFVLRALGMGIFENLRPGRFRRFVAILIPLVAMAFSWGFYGGVFLLLTLPVLLVGCLLLGVVVSGTGVVALAAHVVKRGLSAAWTSLSSAVGGAPARRGWSVLLSPPSSSSPAGAAAHTVAGSAPVRVSGLWRSFARAFLAPLVSPLCWVPMAYILTTNTALLGITCFLAVSEDGVGAVLSPYCAAVGLTSPAIALLVLANFVWSPLLSARKASVSSSLIDAP